MYFLNEQMAISREAINRAVEVFILGVFRNRPNTDLRQERSRNAAYYERYARLCLSSAFPHGLPPADQQELTAELIRRAVEGVYSYRKAVEPRQSKLSLECRWMLEGYLGLVPSLRLESWNWSQGLSGDASLPDPPDSAESPRDRFSLRRRLNEGLMAGARQLRI